MVPSSELRVLLLGPIEVRREGQPLALGGQKQRLLLTRLLIAGGRRVTTGQLVDDLWGAEPPRDPRHALQAHISRLRTLLSVEIDSSSGGYRLDPATVELDVRRFTELCERGRELLRDHDAERATRVLTEALALWRGPVLAGLPDVSTLRGFVVRMEELRRGALLDRIDAALMCGNATGVIGELRDLVQEDPLAERSWRQLMVALHRDGREREALRAYQDARNAFVEELGAEPPRRLTQLHQAILERTLPAGPSGVPETTGSPEPVGLPADLDRRLATPLLGRATELELLERTWAEATDRLRVVTITGEPGIGKTRLAAEFAARRARDGSTVLFGHSDQSFTEPYQPIVEMLRADLADRSEARLHDRLGPRPRELSRLLPQLRDWSAAVTEPATGLDAASDLHRTFDAVAGWLEAISAAGPVVAVVDDVHWADDQTLSLIRHLARSPRRIRGLLLLTLRDREDPDTTGTLFEELMRQSENSIQLPLSGLPPHAVAELLAEEVGGAEAPRPPRRLQAWLTAASGGNPLFVVELARHIGATGATEPPADLPPGLRVMVESRLRLLPPSVLDALAVAAVIGSEFDPVLLAELIGEGPSAVDEVLKAATYARLIVPRPGARLRYGFAHDIVAAVLREGVPPLSRAALHLDIARGLERHRAQDPSVSDNELAHHYAAAVSVGGADRAVHYLRRAGDAALEQQAPSIAARRYAEALELLPGEAPATDRCDLLLALGLAQFRAGTGEYRRTLLEAARLASALGDRERITAAALTNNRGWWSSTAEVDEERVAVIEGALAACPDEDSTTRARLLAAWAVENVRAPDRREAALAAGAEALAVAERGRDDRLLAEALSHRVSVLHATFADPVECMRVSERFLALARRRNDPGLRLNAGIGLAQSAMTLGEFDMADRVRAQSGELARSLNQPSRLWLLRTFEAMCRGTRGDLAGAETEAFAAYELGVRTGQPDAETWLAGQLFTLRLLGRRLPEIVDDVAEQVSSQAWGIPAWRAAHALALAEAGRAQEAGTLLDRLAADSFAALPVDILWLHGMSYLCEVCALLGRADVAPALYEALAPHAGLMAHNGTLDAGPVDLRLASVAGLAGDHAVAEEHLEAAAALANRIDAPLWLDRVRAERRRVRERRRSA